MQQQMGGSSRRSPAEAQRQSDRGHGDAEAEEIGGRKRAPCLRMTSGPEALLARCC